MRVGGNAAVRPDRLPHRSRPVHRHVAPRAADLLERRQVLARVEARAHFVVGDEGVDALVRLPTPGRVVPRVAVDDRVAVRAAVVRPEICERRGCLRLRRDAGEDCEHVPVLRVRDPVDRRVGERGAVPERGGECSGRRARTNPPRGRMLRVREPGRETHGVVQREHVLRVEVRDDVAVTADVRVVPRAEVVDEQTVGASVRDVELVDEPHDVRPHLPRETDVARVEDVVVQRLQPVGVVVEERRARAVEGRRRDRAVVVLVRAEPREHRALHVPARRRRVERAVDHRLVADVRAAVADGAVEDRDGHVDRAVAACGVLVHGAGHEHVLGRSHGVGPDRVQEGVAGGEGAVRARRRCEHHCTEDPAQEEPQMRPARFERATPSSASWCSIS